MIIKNTYQVKGQLIKDVSIGNIERYDRRSIYREVDEMSEQPAADQFESDGWEWAEPPTIRLVTEAMKMERAGQPTLFDLDDERGCDE